MTSVGRDFPRQQERVRHLKEAAVATGDEHRIHFLEGVLHRAAQAQSSGDVLRLLASYNELVEVEEGATP